MSINPVKPSTTPSWETPSWQAFFSHFPRELSSQEKEQILANMLEHLSHLINEQMKRMMQVYKSMRE